MLACQLLGIEPPTTHKAVCNSCTRLVGCRVLHILCATAALVVPALVVPALELPALVALYVCAGES